MDPRVTGAQRYSCHAERPGMLHAAFVRSPYPHARVLSVKGPDDVVVLTPDDVADLNPYGCQVKDQRVLAGVARHIGDVVAAVAAPTRAEARAAAQAVEVEYEELPAVFDALEALDAPPIHEQSVSAGEAVSIEVRPIEGTNVCHRFRIRHGDVAEGFAEAEVVVEETYRVAGAAHAPMEPHAAVAEWEGGRLTLWSGTQTPFNVRSDLAGCFGVARGRDPGHRPGDGRLVRGEDLRAARGARRRPRPQGGQARQGGARPRRGVRHAQPAPGGGQGADRRPPRRHAHRQGGRLLGRHRRLRRLRPGRGDQDGLRRRRALPHPARARGLAGDLHEPAAQRRLPRLRRHAVGVGVRAHDGPAGARARHEPARAAAREPAARRRHVRHRRGHARRALRGVPAGGRRRRRLRGRPARQGPVRAAQGHADAQPRRDLGRAHAGRLRRALRLDRDGPGRAAVDPPDGGADARLRARAGRGPRAGHRHVAVRHAHHVEPVDAT